MPINTGYGTNTKDLCVAVNGRRGSLSVPLRRDHQDVTGVRSWFTRERLV